MDKHVYEQSLKKETIYESMRWILVNTVMCQIPILIMMIQGFSKVDILYSGLSYAVTLLIVANYTLEDLNLYGLKKASVILWLLISLVFLALYQSIKIKPLDELIKNNTIIVYLLFIGIANIMAYMSSYVQLSNNASSLLMKKLDYKKEEADKKKRNLDKIQNEIVLKDGDL